MSIDTRRDEAISAYNAEVDLLNEVVGRMVIRHNEIQILKIIDWTTDKDIERYRLKMSCQHVSHSYSDAEGVIPRSELNPANWLRAVERIAKANEQYPHKLAVIQRFPKKKDATDEDKKEWLRQMNVQVKEYIGNDVELVYKAKKMTAVIQAFERIHMGGDNYRQEMRHDLKTFELEKAPTSDVVINAANEHWGENNWSFCTWYAVILENPAKN